MNLKFKAFSSTSDANTWMFEHQADVSVVDVKIASSTVGPASHPNALVTIVVLYQEKE